jgi:hypothetical protein
VELDMGVSIVTSICLTGEEKLAAIPLGDYFPRRTYGVVMRKGKFLSPQACSFLELMDPDFTGCRHADQMRMPGSSRVADVVEQSVDFTGHDRSYP